MELFGIFTRRDPVLISQKNKNLYPYEDILKHKDSIDVLIVAFGSSENLTEYSQSLAEHFNTVDSFDLHSDIEKHKSTVELSAKRGGKLSLVSCGWDPGLMSLARMYFSAFMPYAEVSTLWGNGVSQGHSEAIRRIKGVKYAVQYTVPTEEGITSAYSGKKLSPERSHKRICFVVCDKKHEKRIDADIRNMPGYFKGYNTEVNFVCEKEFFENHQRLFHKGEVVAFGRVSREVSQSARLCLSLGSNPDFTANILLSCARAVNNLYTNGWSGAVSIFDIPPKSFCRENPESLL